MDLLIVPDYKVRESVRKMLRFSHTNTGGFEKRATVSGATVSHSVLPKNSVLFAWFDISVVEISNTLCTSIGSRIPLSVKLSVVEGQQNISFNS